MNFDVAERCVNEDRNVNIRLKWIACWARAKCCGTIGGMEWRQAMAHGLIVGWLCKCNPPLVSFRMNTAVSADMCCKLFSSLVLSASIRPTSTQCRFQFRHTYINDDHTALTCNAICQNKSGTQNVFSFFFFLWMEGRWTRRLHDIQISFGYSINSFLLNRISPEMGTKE